MPVAFNPPPGWPTPPAGWAPSPGWLPDPSWPAAPPDWQFWTEPLDSPGGLPASAWAPPATAAGLAAGVALPPPADVSGGYGSAAPLRPPWLDPSAAAATVFPATAANPALSAPATPATPATPRDRGRLVAGFGWGGLAVTALAGLASGVGGVLFLAGLFAFVVAVVALVRGRVGWAHLSTRAAGAVALVGAVVAVAVGGAVMPPAAPTSATVTEATPVAPTASSTAAATTPGSATSTVAVPAASASTTPPSTPATDPVASAIAGARPGTALALVATLPLKGRGPMTGYSRDVFGPDWSDTDRNGCDQRNDTLRRDLKAITLTAGTNGCTVMTGTLTDPYTATIVPFTRSSSSTSPVQIDHVVALADAWVKGAAGWPPAKRTAFANDTLNLVAVSSSVNAAKGAGDAATWLPPAKAYRCAYVARQVAVKAKYQLAVTAAERAAMVAVLTTCAGTKTPTATVARLGGFPLYAAPTPVIKATPTPSAKPTPRPAPAPIPAPVPTRTPTPQAPSPIQGVHPGAFCAPQGALGYTSAGTLMRCSFKSGDIRARWRAA